MRKHLLTLALSLFIIGCTKNTDHSLPERPLQSVVLPADDSPVTDTVTPSGPVHAFRAEQDHFNIPVIGRTYKSNSGMVFEVFCPTPTFLSESAAIEILREQFRNEGTDFSHVERYTLEYSRIRIPFSDEMLKDVEGGVRYRNAVVIRVIIPHATSDMITRK
ncbi:MAG: hypothetical protein HGA38_00900 [Candidatus Moranbacteria bacterium]|nr:hypothetical protein [Candidatus Moranbacteria bacterium]